MTRATAGPRYAVRLVEPLLLGVVALVFVRDAVREGSAVRAPSLLLLAAALALDPAYSGARNALQVWLGLLVQVNPTRIVWPLVLVPVGLAALVLLRAARRGPEAQRGLARRAAAAMLAGPAFAVLIVAGYFLGGPLWEEYVVGVPSGLISLTVPLVLGYAVLRHSLFDLDLKVRATIERGTVVGAFAAVVLLGREAAQVVLPPTWATGVGLAATGALVLGLARVQRSGQFVAHAAMPEAEATPAYLGQRKLEVYRAALEEALDPDKPLGGREAAMLTRLRAQLGVTDGEHTLVELAVRSAWGTGPRRAPPAPGEVALGRFRVLRPLGAGAHGATYLAEAPSGGWVVVKALRPDAPVEDAVREARALRGVRHPHVGALHEVVEVAGQAYLVMEHLEGGSLRERLDRGPLPAAEWARVARGLLAGLAAEHAVGIVHRDVEPSNLLLTRDGEAKLGDFGVAHLPGAETTLGGSNPGGAVGTVRYMSPEQARGRRATERSDLFSAAATLFEAWTGQPYLAPLAGESAVELQMRAAAGQAFPEAFDGPASLRGWFARALHVQPEKRVPSAGAALRELERALGLPSAASDRPASAGPSRRGARPAGDAAE